MPSEHAITSMIDVLNNVIELGGTEERTAIVPNLSVIDAAPTGLTNFIIIQDDRDGDNILAKTVPGVVYANSDKVNVLFVKGAEPIAFQQGSESANAGLWEIVPATSTDIQYDKGNVIVGGTPGFTRLFNVVSASGGALVGIEGNNAGGDVTTLLANLGDSNIDTTLEIEARQGTRFGGKIVFGRENALAWSTATNADGFISLNPVLNNTQTERMRVTSAGEVGIGTTDPDTLLHLEHTTSPTLRIQDTTVANSYLDIIDVGSTQAQFNKHNSSGQALIDYNPLPDDNASNAFFRFFRNTDTTGRIRVHFFRGNNSATIDNQIGVDDEDNFFSIPASSNFGIGTTGPNGKLHVDQSSTTAAIPVAYFDQADVSEEMFEFATTIGVGNAIEAVGAKTLTTTHFIKVTLPGSLTRYFPVGTIA